MCIPIRAIGLSYTLWQSVCTFHVVQAAGKLRAPTRVAGEPDDLSPAQAASLLPVNLTGKKEAA